MKAKPVPTIDLVNAILREAASNLALFPFRPHRLFHEAPEPTSAYFDRLRQAYRRSRYHDENYLEELCVQYVCAVHNETHAPPEICAPYAAVIHRLLDDNKLSFTFPQPQSDPAAEAQLRRTLDTLAPYLTLEEKIRDAFGTGVCHILLGIIGSLPQLSGASPLSVPLYALLDVQAVVQGIVATFVNEDAYEDPAVSLAFLHTRNCIAFNVLRASGLSPEQVTKSAQRIKGPADSDLPPQQLIRAYLDGTPFPEFLETPIPFAIPLDSYKEHGFLFAKSGHGKTQTLRALTASLLDQDCALFLIDGNGSLIENLDRITSIQHRLVVLDPSDTPALNFYKLRGASREKQMELFFYLFKAIDQGLTERQATMVAYLVDFMYAIPNSTLDTLREVCDAKTLPYQDHLKSTPPITQDFFTHQFMGNDQLVKQTKNQIASRLYALCRNQAFIAMFNAPENRFDAFEAMQERKIVIVNTDRNLLGDHGSAIFGRYILAQCLAAAFQRPKNARHLALIVCDEAKAYLDDQSQKILSDARAFGLGLLLATQHPDQLQEGVRKEVINNTSVKFAGPAAYSVVAQINRDMRCDPSFILDMKKQERSHAEWACYVDNLTPRAVKLCVPFGTVEKLAFVDDHEHTRMRERNKARYGARSAPPPPQPPTSTPDDDIVW